MVAGLLFNVAAHAAEFNVRLGSLDPTTTAKHRGLLKAAELIKERTNGNVEITVYPSSQLGNAREMTEAVQLGSLEAVINPASFLGGFDPAVAIFDIPYLFPTDPDGARKLRNGPFGEAVLDTFRSRGFEPIALWYGGWKVFSSNKPIANAEDFAGQRFRVMQSKILIGQFASLHASAIALPFGELYTALQNGVIDGQENPIDIIERMKFFEVQKNVVVSNHGAIVEVILFNPTFWKKLPENYQKIVRDAFREVAAEVEKGKREDAKNSLEFLKKAGLNVRIPDSAEERHMHDAMFPDARDTYLSMAGDEGKKLMQVYEQQMKTLAN
ncbi:MAG TPA: TRAP transporter substrate-binding protein [Nitrospira sp.]|nr:TRAP transporter substrate-binding protein [Nitrospira sp.]